VEAQSRGLNPWNNRKELTELVELRRHLMEAEVERVAEAGQLAVLVRDVSKVMVDPGIPPIPGIPRDPCAAGDVLEVANTLFKRLQEAYASRHSPWD
jgi:hypothetical protein